MIEELLEKKILGTFLGNISLECFYGIFLRNFPDEFLSRISEDFFLIF